MKAQPGVTNKDEVNHSVIKHLLLILFNLLAQMGMTPSKQGQRALWKGVVDEDVRALWESWMVEADRLRDDEELIDWPYEAQGERHEHSAASPQTECNRRSPFVLHKEFRRSHALIETAIFCRRLPYDRVSARFDIKLHRTYLIFSALRRTW